MASWGVSFAVVTGASRGFGAEVCRAVCGRMEPGSVLLAVSRTLADMEALRPEVEAKQIKLLTTSVDLSSPAVELLKEAMASAAALVKGPCNTAVLVQNAGSLGTTKYVENLHDWQELSQYYAFNVASTFPVNASFLSATKQMRESSSPDIKLTIINVSSLTAVKPFKSWAVYCSGKAARDMAFRVLAEEQPSVTVLSYAPGPLDTDMHKAARELSEDNELRESFQAAKQNNLLLTVQQSVARMLQVLDAGSFQSGDHVDYYDDIGEKK